MKRVWVIIAGSVLVGLLAVHGAGAQKKGKTKPGTAPTSAKIAESMGELRWGMSKDDLLKKLLRQVKTRYEPLIAKTKNPVEEDRLRNEEQQQLEAIAKSYVEFDGKTTGWDVSFLRGEFAHNTHESMLVLRDRNSQNFYFFIDGKLWKWYKAFDAEVFPADDFNAFQSAVEKRFGSGKVIKSELRAGEGERQWLEWQDQSSRLRAIDQTDFYGFYCLVFEQKATSQQLTKLRGEIPSAGPKRHALVESVTAERDGHVDSAPDIADRISGRVRERPSAQAPAAQAATAKPRDREPAQPAPAPRPSAGPPSDDDPLSGLGL